MTVVLDELTPETARAWDVLFEVSGAAPEHVLLVGGQMMALLCAEAGVRMRRFTVDVDVVVNVRALPGGTRWLSSWLTERGFRFAGASPEGIGHRFEARFDGLDGTVVFDVLAPDGLGGRADTTTVPPSRTVQVPGATQAFARSRPVTVATTSMAGTAATGIVRAPDIPGALIAKAEATRIAERTNPERDWQDATQLLAIVSDPIGLAAGLEAKDRRRLTRLAPLLDADHDAWRPLDPPSRRAGRAALAFILRER